MKYTITGANGFIGSYLSHYLLQHGHEVTAISRSFFPEIRNLLQGATFIEADVLSPEFEKLKLEADVIVHLAASNDIVSKNLAKGIELSAAGTVNTLKLSVNNKIPKFIFYSTLQVYGTELSGEYNENTTVKPENDYAMNHLFGEQYVELYSRKTDLKTLVVRPSNIYGRFLSDKINRWTLVPGCFVKEAVEGGTITLLSSGNQNRNFISLEQLSYYTEMAAVHINKSFDVINFVTGTYKKIVDIAHQTKEIFETCFNRYPQLFIKSNKPEDTNQFYFNPEKLTEYGIDQNKKFDITLETEIKAITSTLLQKLPGSI
jgi:UDP-glucose 4-epimerase